MAQEDQPAVDSDRVRDQPGDLGSIDRPTVQGARLEQAEVRDAGIDPRIDGPAGIEQGFQLKPRTKRNVAVRIREIAHLQVAVDSLERGLISGILEFEFTAAKA